MRIGPVLIGFFALFLTGCATSEEWATWGQHPAHFASAEHLFFSLRNRDGESPRVSRRDIAAARSQGWWGKPITVSTEQILER